MDILAKIIVGNNLAEFFWTILGWISYGILLLASWFMTATGVLLNTSLTLTLNIRDFVTNMVGIYEVWAAIRDLSAMLIIFFVLWAAFQIILGQEKIGGLGTLIKNIVIAGVLINFSFFIVGFLIDASNMISFQIYRQMVPVKVSSISIATTTPVAAGNTSSTASGNNSIQGIVKGVSKQTYERGGISDIFMSAFGATQFYSNKGQLNQAQGGELAIRIFIMQMTGAAAMFVGGLSFLFASLAFIFRLGILIFILAFSPIYFAAKIIPKLDDWAKNGVGMFTGQLLFMPVYLLLMYMALKVVAAGNFGISAINQGDTDFWVSLIGLISNAFFVIILLMIPLIGAASLGGMATNMVSGWQKGVNKWAVNRVKGGVSAVGRNTIGAAAAGMRDSSVARSISRIDPRVGRVINSSLSKVASAGFGGGKKAGYDQSRKARIEEYSKLAEHSNYTDHEAEKIAIKNDLIDFNTGEVKNDLETDALRSKYSNLQNDMSRLGGEFAAATDISEQNRIRAEILRTQEQITKTDSDIKKRRDDILNGIKEAPKHQMAQGFKKHRSAAQRLAALATGGVYGNKTKKFNSDIAKGITKKKKENQDVLDAIKKLEEKE